MGVTVERSQQYFILLFLFFFKVIYCKDTFREELYIKPLPNKHVYAYFQFTTIWDVDSRSDPYQHCHLFPRALGEILSRHNSQELHISLTGGLWRHEHWGYPVFDAPPGAELWVWFKNGTQDVEKTWKELASSLSGLLCASLNFIDTTNSMSPEFSFRPSGVVSSQNINSTLLKYGMLPQEIVCTENLTPWKKLLPCDSKKGLSTLLNAGHIHNTNYHSLGIHVRNICRDKECRKISIELRQTVSLVYDLVVLQLGTGDFSLRKLFGSGLFGSCPLADESLVFIDTTFNGISTLELSPKPSYTTFSERFGHRNDLAVYDIKGVTSMFNIAVTYKRNTMQGQRYPPLLWASRYLSGYGRQKGGIITKIHNNHWKAINVIVLENIPWFVPVYLHTLKVVSGGVDIVPEIVKYTPGRQRVQPTYLELIIKLPPRSVTEVSIELDYVFLKWQEYPPDASHGFYIGSSVITALLPLAKNYTGIPVDQSYFSSSFNATSDGYLVQLRTQTLIITLPTPDFSMPYNVLCLACTVIALAFGPIHNITTKRLRITKVKKPPGLLSILYSKISSLWDRKPKEKTE
ncbi:UNVERIFIED_CONTAM: hypothetical protein PYX00_006333 [Menopon gallinae]|uniref:GPI transamidase component PIG-T n=1 Tax=Menopon gallinae TaxID=328185 RepID=A0AAW2HUY3_9NEOP